MSEPISPQRLAEIRRHDNQHDIVRSVLGPNSAETHRHELLAELDRLTAHVADLEGEREQLMQLIDDLTDEDDCEFDHHGGCQMHGYLSLKPGELCPHAEAKQRVATDGSTR